MELLFDLETTIASESKVDNTDFAEYYPAVNASFSFGMLRPHIRKATNNFILKYIDKTSYKLIIDNPDKEDIVVEVRELLKQAVAEYAIYIALPKNMTVIADMGIMENNSDQSTPASIVKIKMTRWSCICDGDTSLDQALELMEENIDLFPDWISSKQYGSHSSSYFKTTSEFQQYANISGRRAFLALLPHIRKADKSMSALLCSESENILAYLKISEPNDLQSTMIDACKSYIAAKAMLDGLIQTNMVFIGDRYQLASNTETYDTRSKMIATWLGGIDELRNSLKKDLHNAQNEVIGLLEDNEDIYTAYAADHADDDDDSGVVVSDDCVGGVGLF